MRGVWMLTGLGSFTWGFHVMLLNGILRQVNMNQKQIMRDDWERKEKMA